jgi:ubiquinone/menaquinone biosynthesis C-methylase UbiE
MGSKDTMTEHDKLVERARYDARAQLQMIGNELVTDIPLGSQTMSPYLRTPYVFYEQKIAEFIRPGCRVLELGAGAGLHTRALLQTGAQVVASDISPNSLNLLKRHFQCLNADLEIEVADMEKLPFEARSFDAVVSAGSLSYGEPHLVDAEVRRVLRPGGMFICVDSLNHNPIYRLNRWIHYLRGNRSRSTLKRMPDLTRIKGISDGFSNTSVHYFGALSFAMPVIALLLGENAAQATSDRIDQWIGVRRSAFKFVLVAQS